MSSPLRVAKNDSARALSQHGRSGRGTAPPGSPPRDWRSRRTCTGRIQPVVATPACWSDSSCSLRASAGVFQPRVLRGRLLSAAATASISSALQRDEVGALGEVLAQQPVGVLVRAALPGAVRVGEVDRDAGLDLELGVLRTSSLPRSQVSDRRSCSGSVVIVAASAFFIVIGAVAGQRRARSSSRGIDAVAVLAGQVDQHREPGGALDQRADRGAFQPDDQVAFPVPGDGAVLGLGGPLADHHLGRDVRPGLAAARGRGEPAAPARCAGRRPAHA